MTKARKRLVKAGTLLGVIAFALVVINSVPVKHGNLLVRLHRDGLHDYSGLMTTEELIAKARRYGVGVDLMVAGDVVQGDLDALVRALNAAGVTVRVLGRMP